MVFTRRDWRGAENLPPTGGFVVCPNHISHVDPFAFAHFLYDNGHPPFFLAKSEVFEIPILGRMLIWAADPRLSRYQRGRPGLLSCCRLGTGRQMRSDIS